MGITMKELGEMLGVSRGTIDRALNDRPGINEDTRQMILDAAKAHGYKRNYLASSLKKGKTSTIGVIVFELHNQFFSQLIHAIDERLRNLGYSVQLCLTNKDGQLERKSVQQLVQRKMDGIILASVNKDPAYIKELEQLRVPLVSVGNRISSKISHVDIDNKGAMQQIVDQVIAKGYERVTYVAPPLSKKKSNIDAQEERYKGFIKAAEERDLPYNTVTDNRELTALYESLSEYKGQVLVCSSDVYALEIMKRAISQGYHIPKDFGLVGFDNLAMLEYVTPALTTMAYPFNEVGYKAVDLLIESINTKGTKVSRFFMPCEFIEGSTL